MAADGALGLPAAAVARAAAAMMSATSGTNPAAGRPAASEPAPGARSSSVTTSGTTGQTAWSSGPASGQQSSDRFGSRVLPTTPVAVVHTPADLTAAVSARALFSTMESPNVGPTSGTTGGMLMLLDAAALCSTTKVGLAKEATGAAPARPLCSTLESPDVGPVTEATGVLLCSAMDSPCAGPSEAREEPPRPLARHPHRGAARCSCRLTSAAPGRTCVLLGCGRECPDRGGWPQGLRTRSCRRLTSTTQSCGRECPDRGGRPRGLRTWSCRLHAFRHFLAK